jgi:hypothetical protein
MKNTQKEPKNAPKTDDLQALGALLAANQPLPDGELPAISAARLLRVRSRTGHTVPLRANRVQRAFEQNRTDRNIVLKARQMGMTTWIAGRFFLKTITQPGVLTVLVAHTREAAEGIFSVVHRMWANLPDDWKRNRLKRSRANANQMVFAALDSEFRVVSAGEENAGRGLTIQNLHLSEVARWQGNAAHETLAGLKAALAPGGELTLESTPAGASGAFYEEWQQADEAGLTRHFFPWWLEPAYTAAPVLDPTGEERSLAALHGLSPAQLGYRRKLERAFRGMRAQEFAEDAESCFRASGNSCFSIEAIDRHFAQACDPVQIRRDGALHVWLPPAMGRAYLLGVDTAGGGSEGDYAAIQVIDLASGLQCAELRERLGPLDLARAAAQLAREYRGATIAVERNNHGAAVLAYLAATERYDNVYAPKNGGPNGVAGWLTTAGNKPQMVSRIGALLEEAAQLFFSRRLLAECRTFITHANGSTGAASGAHDDCLMAMAVAHAVRAEGT